MSPVVSNGLSAEGDTVYSPRASAPQALQTQELPLAEKGTAEEANTQTFRFSSERLWKAIGAVPLRYWHPLCETQNSQAKAACLFQKAKARPPQLRVGQTSIKCKLIP